MSCEAAESVEDAVHDMNIPRIVILLYDAMSAAISFSPDTAQSDF